MLSLNTYYVLGGVSRPRPLPAPVSLWHTHPLSHPGATPPTLPHTPRPHLHAPRTYTRTPLHTPTHTPTTVTLSRHHTCTLSPTHNALQRTTPPTLPLHARNSTTRARPCLYPYPTLTPSLLTRSKRLYTPYNHTLTLPHTPSHLHSHHTPTTSTNGHKLPPNGWK